jgi:glycerol kinase
MDLRERTWSEEMCELWGIPRAVLPDIVPSAGIVAKTRGVPGLRDGIPIAGIAGDQHAALFGQGCVLVGDAKCTYGTGAFVLVNTGPTPVPSQAGLLTTLAWQIGEEVVYALEGASFIAGAAVQWLRDGLGLITRAHEIEALAASVATSEGVTFVPALAGLGAPYWDPEARGLICGITRGTTKAHLARATLEAIAFEVDDLLRAMDADLRAANEAGLRRLRVDGGAAANNLLMQMQADFSCLPVDRPTNVESTARGAALLAAIGVGALSGPSDAAATFELDRAFLPLKDRASRENARSSWEQAVARTRSNIMSN